MDKTHQDSSSTSSDTDSNSNSEADIESVIEIEPVVDPNAGADIESVIEPVIDPDALRMARQSAEAQVIPGADPNAVMTNTVQWYVDVLGFPKSAAKAL